METKTERIEGKAGAWCEVATVTFQGRDFAAMGASVTPGEACGYPEQRPDGRWDLNSFDGKKIGEGIETATWRTPRSYLSSTWSQFHFMIDGRAYTGRGAGAGMFWRGRPTAAQRRKDSRTN